MNRILLALLIVTIAASAHCKGRDNHPEQGHRQSKGAEGHPDPGIALGEHGRPDNPADGHDDGTRLTKESIEVNRDVAKATWRLVHWTAALVLVGIAVGFFQLYLLRGSLEAAQQAASAANSNAKTAGDALRLEQRPWVLPLTDIGREHPEDMPEVVRPQKLILYIKNYGRSPALQMRAKATWMHDRPSDPALDVVPTVDLPIEMIAPGEQQRVPLNEIPVTTFNRVWTGGDVFRVFGQVEYWDSFKRNAPYITRFSFRLVVRDTEASFVQEGPFNDCT